MSLMEKIIDKAKKLNKTIILPEGHEERILQAAEIILEDGIANVIIVGNKDEILAKHPDLSKATIILPETSEYFEKFVDDYYEMRKSKGMTMSKSAETMMDPMYFASMMLKAGHADGLVGGATYATSDVLRPNLQIVKTAPGISIVSSYFLMEFEDTSKGDNGVYIYADCGVVIDPNEEELAAIAIASAESAKKIAGLDPRVAMLSFSTKGSASHKRVDKVVNATNIAKELRPDLVIDGELQVDAAIVPKVAESKAPGSAIAGRANVLIFPDLDSGNIAYKLTQRIGGAAAMGPLCQGFAKPVNDLSRGCNVQDIVNVVAITALQTQ